jgi:hypothetical protein
MSATQDLTMFSHEQFELPTGKPEIFTADGDLLEIVDQIEAALVAGDKELFQKNGAIYWKGPNGIVKANATVLRMRAMQFAVFSALRGGKYGPRLVHVDVPTKYLTALLAKGKWAFPELDETLTPSK